MLVYCRGIRLQNATCAMTVLSAICFPDTSGPPKQTLRSAIHTFHDQNKLLTIHTEMTSLQCLNSSSLFTLFCSEKVHFHFFSFHNPSFVHSGVYKEQKKRHSHKKIYILIKEYFYTFHEQRRGWKKILLYYLSSLNSN